jgi:hypothetical protein
MDKDKPSDILYKPGINNIPFFILNSTGRGRLLKFNEFTT